MARCRPRGQEDWYDGNLRKLTERRVSFHTFTIHLIMIDMLAGPGAEILLIRHHAKLRRATSVRTTIACACPTADIGVNAKPAHV
jgi:hypothetical protein